MTEITGLMDKVMMEVSLWWCWVSNPFLARKGKKIPFGSLRTPVEDVQPPCVSWPFRAWLSLYGAGAPRQEGRGAGLGTAAARPQSVTLQQDLRQRGSGGKGRKHSWHPNPRWRGTHRAHGYPQASWEVQPFPAHVFSWHNFRFCIPIHCQPWSRDFLPPVACLEVATSIHEMDFSTSKARARRVVEEVNNMQVNPLLVVIANITGFHNGKGEQRKRFKWLPTTPPPPPPPRPTPYILFFHHLHIHSINLS